MTALEGDGFRLRPATEEDIPFLADLAARTEVADSLAAVSPWMQDAVRNALAPESDDHRLVLEAADGRSWVAAGALGWEVANSRSRIAHLHGVMVDPAFRGRRLGERASRLVALHLLRESGFHRVQLEVYGFNVHAQRAFERAGFTREGVRRRAYWRHGRWTDGVLYGLVAEDLAGED